MIVVTGASGIMGRAVLDRLKTEGIEAIGVTRQLVDLTESGRLTRLVLNKPQSIIHLAAAVPHSAHYKDDERSAAITQKIDQAVFEAALEWDCRVIYASTLSLYDKRLPIKKHEKMFVVANPNSPYIRAKLAGERLFSMLPSSCILRMPAPLGQGLPDTLVVKRFLNQAIHGKVMQVWGTGKREQNFVDVRDISEIIFKAARSTTTEVINVCADLPTTMLELADEITRVVPGASFELNGCADPLEFEYARYSNSLALESLEWSPKISLRSSLSTLYKDYCEN